MGAARAKVAGVVGSVIALVLASIGVRPASAAPMTETFQFTGAAQSFVVPAGVNQVSVDAFGAQGGNEGFADVAGGLGGRATAILAVTPCETLEVHVGGKGRDGAFVPAGSGPAAGAPAASTAEVAEETAAARVSTPAAGAGAGPPTCAEAASV